MGTEAGWMDCVAGDRQESEENESRREGEEGARGDGNAGERVGQELGRTRHEE